MVTDHFAEDRDKLARLTETIADAGVELGEWAADNILGDPLLRQAIVDANAAEGALRAAHSLARHALNALPDPPEEG